MSQRDRARGYRWFDPPRAAHELLSCVRIRMCMFPTPVIMPVGFQSVSRSVDVCGACFLAMLEDMDHGPVRDLVLFCPKCGGQHVDQGDWKVAKHRTHLCEFCGELWRPSRQNTRGVPVPPGGSGSLQIDPHTGRPYQYLDLRVTDTDRLYRIYVEGLYP